MVVRRAQNGREPLLGGKLISRRDIQRSLMVMAGEGALIGYRSVDNITFNLDGKDKSDLAWVIFEVAQGDLARTTGVLGTINNHVTLELMRLIRAQKTIRIRGAFNDRDIGETSDWTLQWIAATGARLEDTSSFIGFRAVASRHHPTK